MQLIILGIIVLVIWVYIDDKKKRNRRLVISTFESGYCF